MTLLDSDIFTLAFHGHPKVSQKLERARTQDEVAIPIFVRAESLRGRFDAILKAASTDDVLRIQIRLDETEAFLRTFAIVLFNEAAGLHFAKLVAMKSLKNTGRADLLIACVALAHGATLVTRNTKDFAGIPNLKLENWAA
jgi:tRNA(fMet)-specific endonuclease VapC